MPVTATFTLDMQFSGSTGAWTDVRPDVLTSPGISISYGINGNGPEDRVADTGTMNFSLNNSVANSGGVVGYYSPIHANARSGFTIGIGTRLTIIYSGSTMYKSVGRIDDIVVVPGKFGPRSTSVTVVDWIDEAAKHKLKQIALQINVLANAAINTVVNNMTRKPSGSSLATAQMEYPYALDTAWDEETTALGEFQRIANSDLGFIFISGSGGSTGAASTGNILVFQDRRTRLAPSACKASLNDTMVMLQPLRSRSDIYNHVKMTVHPRNVDTVTTTVLYSLFGKPTAPAGCTLILEGNYTDPTLRSQRVGGASMVTPVETTDYTMGTDENGTNLTTDFTVTASYGANTVRYELANAGSQNAIVSKLQARGAGIYDYSPYSLAFENATSTASFGRNDLDLDLPYESHESVASSLGEYILGQLDDPFNQIEEISFIGNTSDALMKAGLQVEPGDLVTITETVTGINNEFFVNGCGLQITGLGQSPQFRFSWKVVRRLDTTLYWILNTDQLNGVECIIGV